MHQHHHLRSVNIALLDHEVDRDLALETADVALTEVVAQLVNLKRNITASQSVNHKIVYTVLNHSVKKLKNTDLNIIINNKYMIKATQSYTLKSKVLWRS